MNPPPLETYKTLVFDCDGVVLDSNRVKTKAFWQAAAPYGKAAADALVNYHVENGGVSRYEKFAYFLDELIPRYAGGLEGPTIDSLLEVFADFVRAGLESCRIAENLDKLRAQSNSARWMIVSGGDQTELRSVFRRRGIIELFDGGVFGSPDSKTTILKRQIADGNARFPALFIGDSRYDHEAASAVNMDFIFVRGWTEFPGWEKYCRTHGLSWIEKISDLIEVDNE